jgi:hypothetical protein
MLLVEVIGYVGLIAMIAFVTSLVCSMLGRPSLMVDREDTAGRKVPMACVTPEIDAIEVKKGEQAPAAVGGELLDARSREVRLRTRHD